MNRYILTACAALMSAVNPWALDDPPRTLNPRRHPRPPRGRPNPQRYFGGRSGRRLSRLLEREAEARKRARRNR